MREKVIIEPGQSGLGDNFLFTSLPELFVRERNAEVYVRHVNFRNNGIPELLWNTNPFVSGIVYDQGTIKGVGWDEITKLHLKYDSSIKALEAYHGFKPQNMYPRLYNVMFKYKPELADKILIDPTAFTIKYNKEFIHKFIDHLKYYDLIKLEKCLVVDPGPTHWGENLLTDDILPHIPRIKMENIFDYANSIASCSIFIGAASGSVALASAIKSDGYYPSRIYSFVTSPQRNQRVWVWENVEYFTGDNLYDDFRRF